MSETDCRGYYCIYILLCIRKLALSICVVHNPTQPRTHSHAVPKIQSLPPTQRCAHDMYTTSSSLPFASFFLPPCTSEMDSNAHIHTHTHNIPLKISTYIIIIIEEMLHVDNIGEYMIGSPVACVCCVCEGQVFCMLYITVTTHSQACLLIAVTGNSHWLSSVCCLTAVRCGSPVHAMLQCSVWTATSAVRVGRPIAQTKLPGSSYSTKDSFAQESRAA